jgi:large subunit ribosomal protein L13
MYYRHSGYPGGLRQRTLREQLERRPTEVLRIAVKGMLPKNKLASAQIRKLKIYAGPEHPHAAQLPQPLGVGSTEPTKSDAPASPAQEREES